MRNFILLTFESTCAEGRPTGVLGLPMDTREPEDVVGAGTPGRRLPIILYNQNNAATNNT
jgi:hypothetical protein